MYEYAVVITKIMKKNMPVLYFFFCDFHTILHEDITGVSDVRDTQYLS